MFKIKTSKEAFSLAEVLVTIGLIGIVAAMTLPSVINNARNKALEANFKQAYSLIYQAVLSMGNDDPTLWQTYCASGAGKPSSSYNSYAFLETFSQQFQTVGLYKKRTRDLQALGYKQSQFYLASPGKTYFNFDSHDNGAFIAKNGMIVFISGCWWSNALDFVVDTNGHKGPNKFGWDVFYFQIDKNTNQLLPSSTKYHFASLGSESANCCGLDGQQCGIQSDNGSACSKFAIMDSYPSDIGKPYWKNLPIP